MNIMTLGPGGGKTTSAMQLAKELLENDVRVTYLTITNTAIDDITQRFHKLHGSELTDKQVSNFQATTMHTFALSLIRERNTHIKIIPTVELKPLPADVLNDASKADEFVKAIRGMVTNNITDGKPSKELILPLAWVIPFIIAFRIKPDNSDILIIDEYQDMDTNEIYALASIFEDNAYLYGDLNQTIYQFRFPNGNTTVSNNSMSKAPSYRFKQETCDFLNRFLIMKDAMLPNGSTNLTMLFEPGYDKLSTYKKNKREPSIHLVKFTDAVMMKESGKKFSYFTVNNSKRMLPEYFREHIDPKSPHENFAIISATNNIAVEYSKLIKEYYGNDILQVWYEPVYYHPLYKLIRDALTGTNSIHNFEPISVALTRALTKLGYQCSLQRTKSTLETIAARRMNETPKSIVSLPHVLKVLDLIEKDELPQSMYISRDASNKSNRNAALTILSMLSTKGLRSAFSGIRLQSDNARPGRILTIHSAKGVEADYVFLDISQQGRQPKTHNDYIQQLNMLYVAMSRHREKLYITVEPYQSDDSMSDKTSTTSMRDMMEGLFRLGYLISEQENLQTELNTQDIGHIYDLQFSKIVSTLVTYAQHDNMFKREIQTLIEQNMS